MKKFILKNHLLIILLVGLFLRLFFYFFGAKVYYGKSDFFINGDTSGWVTSILNLINHGTYSVDLSEPKGFFFRPPGYSFFIGIFYLISGKNLDLTYKLIIWAQIFMDVISIWLIYAIVQKTFNNKLWSSLAALLYLSYPFIIVWTPIVYAESASVFFLLWGIWFFVNENIKRHFFWSGLVLGIAALIRLQLIFFFPAMLVAFFFHFKWNTKALLKASTPIMLGFIITYGLWPIRNFVMHDTVMFSQDLTSVSCWDKDYMGFMDYVFAVKTDHEPQYSQIIRGGTKVEWPKAAYIVPGDSEKLALVSKLCHDCGHGFSVFMKNEGFRKGDLPQDSSCSLQISEIWKSLKENQVKYNSLLVYFWVPLSNLKKSFFKSGLYKPSSSIVNLVSTLLFGYRTIMILFGLTGLFLYWRVNKKFPLLFKLIFCYFILWYFWNSFMYRNMEMRFLLQADLLLLISAAYIFVFIIEKYFLRNKKNDLSV